MHRLWNHPALKEDYENIRIIMEETVDSSSPVIRQHLQSLFSSQGKLIRPMLLVLASRCTNHRDEKIRRKIQRIGAAIEILHLATLVHDDIIDDSPLRRGNPALHTQIGTKSAVLIGDYLFSRCFNIVAEYASVENAQRLAKVVSRICSSEIRQTEDAFAYTVSIRSYNRRIAGKTAALFTLSCFIGASESGAKASECGIFRRIGYNLGMGFQIKDDILDYTSTQNRLGKPVGYDVQEGITTLPLIYALQGDDGKLRKMIEKPRLSQKNITTIINQVVSKEGILKAEQSASLYTERAFTALSCLPHTEGRDLLYTTVDGLLNRTY